MYSTKKWISIIFICGYTLCDETLPFWDYSIYHRLGHVVVSVLATGLKGHGFEPGQGIGFLMMIKVHSTPSFRWEVKPEVSCHKIFRHVKDLLKSHGDG
jgi:hypothetical protein